jgi:hypothetical protein
VFSINSLVKSAMQHVVPALLSIAIWDKSAHQPTFHNTLDRFRTISNSCDNVASIGPRKGMCGWYRPQFTTQYNGMRSSVFLVAAQIKKYDDHTYSKVS